METVHNPDRFMADFRQILSQGRKRIGLLVGAGAPMSVKINQDNAIDPKGHSLIPGVQELTTLAVNGLTNPNYRAAVKAIQAELGSKANIETILSRVRLLQQALSETKLHSLNGQDYGDAAQAICEQIGKIVNARLPKERSAFDELIAWISGTLREHPVEIFTTNYDMLFEEAFERVRAPYFDGFSGGASPFFDSVTVAGNDLPPRWSRLWKLHGSLGWRLDDEAVVRTGGRGEAQLIYPDHLKYDLTQKQPYAALFERLKQFMLEPDTLLLAIGFSFRDAHVCAVLDETLAMNANSAVFAFQYCNLNQEEAACQIALDRPNMSVYGADAAVINGVRGDWRPGELPKNWEDIRGSFWSFDEVNDSGGFLLGDFGYFSRFCALAQASELTNAALPETPDTSAINENNAQ